MPAAITHSPVEIVPSPLFRQIVAVPHVRAMIWSHSLRKDLFEWLTISNEIFAEIILVIHETIRLRQYATFAKRWASSDRNKIYHAAVQILDALNFSADPGSQLAASGWTDMVEWFPNATRIIHVGWSNQTFTRSPDFKIEQPSYICESEIILFDRDTHRLPDPPTAPPAWIAEHRLTVSVFDVGVFKKKPPLPLVFHHLASSPDSTESLLTRPKRYPMVFQKLDLREMDLSLSDSIQLLRLLAAHGFTQIRSMDISLGSLGPHELPQLAELLEALGVKCLLLYQASQASRRWLELKASHLAAIASSFCFLEGLQIQLMLPFQCIINGEASRPVPSQPMLQCVTDLYPDFDESFPTKDRLSLKALEVFLTPVLPEGWRDINEPERRFIMMRSLSQADLLAKAVDLIVDASCDFKLSTLQYYGERHLEMALLIVQFERSVLRELHGLRTQGGPLGWRRSSTVEKGVG